MKFNNIIENLELSKYPVLLKFFIFLIRCKKIFLLIKMGKFKWLKNREWIVKYNIPKEKFNSKIRKHGISAFARLKNGEDFLEETIRSHLPFFDEIILVDNNSEDSTLEICQKMVAEFPDKIKFYVYEPIVYSLGSKEYKAVANDSVHCMSYYYNWTLAKTTYKYVIKLDDDHICIPDVVKDITSKIKWKWLSRFLLTPLINIYDHKWKKSYSLGSIKAAVAWLFGDFWFFKVSNRTYFIKQPLCETLLFPYFFKFWPISFLHLKNLKKDWWLINLDKEMQWKLKKRYSSWVYLPLSRKYQILLKENWIN